MVSDPKACNNIIVKDQAIFDETESFLMYAFFSLQRKNWRLSLIREARTGRHLGQRSFLRQASTLFSIPHIHRLILLPIQVLTTEGNANC